MCVRVTDDIACEKQCTFFQDFPCRSFAFYTSASQCFISGDDQQSAALGALQSRPGTDYFERSCETLFSSVEETDNLILDSQTTSGEGVVPGQTLPQERRCTFGRLEYEKTTGQSRLGVTHTHTSHPAGYELIRAGPKRLHSRREGGISSECASRCQANTNCQGFNMDYNRNECQSVVENSEDNLFNLRPSTGVAFFEAICLRGKVIKVIINFKTFKTPQRRKFGAGKAIIN